MNRYDAAVIGVGGIGSAALFHLASRGLRVIGLEQFSIAHDRGSSHGQTRIIRQAYFEHSAYVPLLRRSFALWRALEELTQQRLFEPVGLLEIGHPDGFVLQGIEKSAREHSLEIERMTPSESEARFPMYRVPDGMEAIFEPTAGLLYVESCVAAFVRAAEQHGASVLTNTQVQQIEFESSPIAIDTGDERIQADRVVICGGAWTTQLLDFSLPLRIARKHLHWFPTDRQDWQAQHNCPTFFYELPEGCYYGFPAIDSIGVKVGEHSGGDIVLTPEQVDRSPSAIDDQRVLNFLNGNLINLSPQRARHATCLYTLTPDEHFIVDRHAENDCVAFAAGLSGHGFKFAPVLGEVLADLVVQGQTHHPIDFLSATRFDLGAPESGN